MGMGLIIVVLLVVVRGKSVESERWLREEDNGDAIGKDEEEATLVPTDIRDEERVRGDRDNSSVVTVVVRLRRFRPPAESCILHFVKGSNLRKERKKTLFVPNMEERFRSTTLILFLVRLWSNLEYL